MQKLRKNQGQQGVQQMLPAMAEAVLEVLSDNCQDGCLLQATRVRHALSAMSLSPPGNLPGQRHRASRR